MNGYFIWYNLTDKNARSKRTYYNREGAMVTKRFGTNGPGEKKL